MTIGSDRHRQPLALADWITTGFSFGALLKSDVPLDKASCRVWLITNRHVPKDRKEIHVTFTSTAGPDNTDYSVLLVARSGKPPRVGNPAVNTGGFVA